MVPKIFDTGRAIREIYTGGGGKLGAPPMERYPMDEIPSPMDPNPTAIEGQAIPYEFRQVGQEQQQDPRSIAARQQMLDMINTMPQREKPSKWRRVGAMVAGMDRRDPNAAEDFLNAPYNRKMGEFKSKFDALGKVADLEAREESLTASNYYRDLLAGSRRADDVRADARLDFDIKRAADEAQRKERVLRIKEQYAKGGKIIKNKETGKTYMAFGDGSKVDMDINDLSQQDIVDMANKAHKDYAKYNNDLTRDRMRLQQDLILTRKTKEKERGIGGSSDSGQSETQKAAEIKNRALEIQNRFPDTFGKYVTFDGDKPRISEEGEGGFFEFFTGDAGLSPDDRKFILDYIYQGVGIPDTGPGAAGATGTQGGGGTLPAPVGSAVDMNAAIAAIGRENQRRAGLNPPQPPIPTTKANIDATIAKLKKAAEGKK